MMSHISGRERRSMMRRQRMQVKYLQLKELGKEKTYTVTKEDIGSKIVLTITGKEENGYSGTLTVTSDEVVDAESGAALEAAAEAQTEDASEETGEDQTTDEENTDDQQDNADSTEDTEAAGAETVDEIPPATSDDQQTEAQVTEEQPQEEQPEQTGETTGSADRGYACKG